jgi:hemerythrin
MEKELAQYPDLLTYLTSLERQGGELAPPGRPFSLQEYWAREEVGGDREWPMAGVWAWEESWNTRIAFIDHQHQVFIEHVNALQQAVVTGNRSRVLELIPQLTSHVQQHFQLEERLMELAAYPGRQSHLVLHRTFGDTVERTCQALERGDVRSLGLLKDLRVKLVRHMVEEDKRYAPWLRQRLGNRWLDDLWHLVIR